MKPKIVDKDDNEFEFNKCDEDHQVVLQDYD